MNEVWKDITGYEDLYQVSNLGRVYSIRKHKIINERKKKRNNKPYYSVVRLCKNGIIDEQRVHILVAKAFIPNPGNLPMVNHIDENKRNNVITNLEWISLKDNLNHGTRNERISRALLKSEK